MFKKTLIVLLLLTTSLITISITSTSSQAQIRSYSNEFLSLGVGARSLAMGNAQTAISGDVMSAYWNPAGLNAVENFQVGIMHAEWFAGIGKYDYLGLSTPIDGGKKAVGLSIIRFGVDDIPNTLQVVDPAGNIDYDRITTFSAADYAALLTYAQEWRKLRVGGNVKIVHRKVGPFANSWGFGLDIGLQYDVSDQFVLGATIKDLTTTPNFWSFNFTEEEKEILEITDNVIPVNSVELTGQRIVLGAAYNLDLGEKLDLLAELDVDLTFDQRNVLINTSALSLDPHLGLEFGYDQLVYLRAGINNMQRFLDDDDPNKEVLSLQPNAGLGIRVKNIHIDYALTGFNNLSQGIYSHVFSLKLDLGNGLK